MKTLLLLITAIIVVSSDTSLNEFTAGNHLFTARLYKEILKVNPNKNFVFSPLSIEIILALTQAGAAGQTAEEFVTALNLPNTLEKTQNALKEFLPKLTSDNDKLKLLSANKMFLGKNFEFKKSFQELATNVFKAGIENVDFSNNIEAAKSINQWVEDQTNNKIKDLLDPGQLSELTRLVLVNALYFKGKWASPFEDYLTRKEKFYITKSNTKEVDMMHGEDTFRYYECTKRNAKFLELPYVGDDITMTIVLPNEIEGLGALENNIENLFEAPPYQNERVAVSLPKWLVETKIELKPILKNLGLKKAFTGEAQFPNISNEGLFIDDVVQKAFINVTESGTEAAAATAVNLVFLSAPVNYPADKFFRADHPFLYLIKYNDVLLFVGTIRY